MKLIVQIPAYNEQDSIKEVIKSIPRKIPGITKVEILVLDDGSKDKTSEVARKAGADYVYKNTKNQGLAYTFQKAMDLCLEHGADVIVNTDADNQYDQNEIKRLVRPILDQKADIVNGNRQVHLHKHMGVKRNLNRLGTKFVQYMAGYKIKDASSGFRAYSREAALKLFVITGHTYTHQTLIQAGHKNLRVIEIPVTFRKRNGHSKLITGIFDHIKKSVKTITRVTLMYNSLRVLGYIGAMLILIGLVPIIRWYILSYILNDGGEHIQSLILGVLIVIFGGLSIMIGLISDLIALNRRHLEEILYLSKKRVYSKKTRNS